MQIKILFMNWNTPKNGIKFWFVNFKVALNVSLSV